MIDLTALVQACTQGVDPAVMTAIVRAESAGNPLALVDAGQAGKPWSWRKSRIRVINARSRQEAEMVAEALGRAGHIVAVGLAQVTNINLARFGLTPAQSFDPCLNLAAGARVFFEAQSRAASLEEALSFYNTGTPGAGIRNGYAGRVLSFMGQPAGPASEVRTVRVSTMTSAGRDPYTAPLDASD